MKVILMCGDRNWTDRKKIRQQLLKHKPDIIIQGEARGADSIAREEAKKLGIEHIDCPADWTRYGRAAGPIRNKEMLARLLDFSYDGHYILIQAFHSDLSQSKGTKDMVTIGTRAGVPVEIIK
jgi:hypothetical protein